MVIIVIINKVTCVFIHIKFDRKKAFYIRFLSEILKYDSLVVVDMLLSTKLPESLFSYYLCHLRATRQ